MCSKPIREVEIRYKQKDVIVHCKALCKIHIYRIIKSVQTQVACTWLLCGVGRSQGRVWVCWRQGDQPSQEGHPQDPGALGGRRGHPQAHCPCPPLVRLPCPQCLMSEGGWWAGWRWRGDPCLGRCGGGFPCLG